MQTLSRVTLCNTACSVAVFQCADCAVCLLLLQCDSLRMYTWSILALQSEAFQCHTVQCYSLQIFTVTVQ